MSSHWLSSFVEARRLSLTKLTLCIRWLCGAHNTRWFHVVRMCIFMDIFLRTVKHAALPSHCAVGRYWFHYLQIACLCRYVNRNAWLCSLGWKLNLIRWLLLERYPVWNLKQLHLLFNVLWHFFTVTSPLVQIISNSASCRHSSLCLNKHSNKEATVAGWLNISDGIQGA